MLFPIDYAFSKINEPVAQNQYTIQPNRYTPDDIMKTIRHSSGDWKHKKDSLR